MEREELLMQIVEKQKELIRRRCQHSPSCSINQNWDEALQAMADTPVAYQDAGYYEAISEIERKSKECTCGLNQLESELDSLTSQLEKTEKSNKPAESAEEIDLMQYVTNLLYYAHVEAMSMHSIDFDKWVEDHVDNLNEYFAQSHQVSQVTDEDIENESQKIIMNYLTHNNFEGDFKESTIGSDDKRIWWVKGAKAMRDGQIPAKDSGQITAKGEKKDEVKTPEWLLKRKKKHTRKYTR